MTTARILFFEQAPRTRALSINERTGEPVSPFRRLMPARPLTPREVLHRRRMLDGLGNSCRLTPVMR